MWQWKQIKIDNGNRMLYSITDHTKPISTSLWPPVSWERKSWMTLECEPTQAFPDIWFWGAHPPPTCQSFAMQRSNGHCFNVCVLAGRGKGAWFRCHCAAKVSMGSERKVLCTKYPLHPFTQCKLQWCMTLQNCCCTYLTFPSQKRGVTPTPILSPKEFGTSESASTSVGPWARWKATKTKTYRASLATHFFWWERSKHSRQQK